jgi:1-aminocyclopropane-1-carboxylate deaminase/D-cysteine desulfhydrase-like pyridoxal-dependent ACC family enzyme
MVMNINWISPIEEYDNVLYKRDDLFSPFDNGVNGGKARQAISLLTNNLKYIQDVCDNTVITATNIDSPQGIIISTVANSLNIKSIVAFGYHWGRDKLIENNNLVKKSIEAGGNIQIVANASYTSTVNSAVQKIVNDKNYFPVKFGINASTNADSIFGVIENQVQNIPKDLDLLLIPVGSGLIFSGIIRGLLKYNIKPKRIVGILSGMDSIKDIENNLISYNVKNKHADETIDDFFEVEYSLEYELYKSDINYHKKIIIDEPFNIDPIYEAKTIRWFDKEIELGNISKEDKNLIWIVGNQRIMY